MGIGCLRSVSRDQTSPVEDLDLPSPAVAWCVGRSAAGYDALHPGGRPHAEPDRHGNVLVSGARDFLLDRRGSVPALMSGVGRAHAVRNKFAGEKTSDPSGPSIAACRR